jgi:hypothetical protein
MYVIAKGEAEIIINDKVVSELVEGEHFGENALYTICKR